MSTTRGPIALIQLPVPSLTPVQSTGNVPLGIGTLARYLQRLPGAGGTEVLIPPQTLLTHGGDAALIEWLDAACPRAAGLSLSVWNVERTTALARRLLERRPDVRVWFGGPEVAADAWCMRGAGVPFECAVEGEGEGSFALLAAGVPPSDINGLLTPNGRTKGSHDAPLVQSLDEIHDPFIAGLVTPENDGVVLAEFQRGCAYQCAFCRYHQNRPAALRAVRSEANIGALFAWAREAGAREVYILDPSLEQRRDLNAFCAMLARVNQGPQIAIAAELRAEHIDEQRARLLAEAGVRTVETGLQTTNEKALAALGRRVDLHRFERGTAALRAHGIDVRIDIMVGLPGDSSNGLVRTISYVNERGLGGRVQIFHTQVLPGTELRARAHAFGVAFDNTPPYFVRSTPDWPADELAGALTYAQDRLGISNAPEERPVLPLSSWCGQGLLRARLSGGATWALGWDCTGARGRECLAAESFGDLATAATLWVKVGASPGPVTAVRDALRRCCIANPFTALCVVVDMPVGAPLDIVDSIRGELGNESPSRYAAGMYASADRSNPLRRVAALLPIGVRYRAPAGWLDELRRVAEVVWQVEGTAAQIRDRIRASVGQGDWLFADCAPSAQHERWFQYLADAAADPSRILLPGTELHWEWLRFLAQSGRE